MYNKVPEGDVPCAFGNKTLGNYPRLLILSLILYTYLGLNVSNSFPCSVLRMQKAESAFVTFYLSSLLTRENSTSFPISPFHFGRLSTLSLIRSIMEKSEAFPQDPVQSRLIGAWTLLSTWAEVQFKESGTTAIEYPYGQDGAAQGMLLYTLDGYMSAQLSWPRAIQDVSPSATSKSTPSSSLGHLAYSGRYEIPASTDDADDDDSDHRIVHHIMYTTFADWLGRRQNRYLKIEGDIVTIKTDPIISEVRETQLRTAIVRLERGKGADSSS